MLLIEEEEPEVDQGFGGDVFWPRKNVLSLIFVSAAR